MSDLPDSLSEGRSDSQEQAAIPQHDVHRKGYHDESSWRRCGMELVSVNVGAARPLEVGGRSIRTGIFKRAVPSVQIDATGLAGDAVCDARHHGGPDQAVYVYTMDDYAWFERELGLAFTAGAFGENVTLQGCESAAVAVGDRFAFVAGEVVLEASAPRIPCNTLATSLDNAALPRHFRAAERPGFYCRVVHPGLGNKGMPVTYTPVVGERVTMAELFRAAYEAAPAADVLRRHLGVPLSARERERKERQLAAIE